VEIEIMENENKLRKELLEWLETIVISVVCVVLVFTFLFRMVGISGASMEETLHGSDRVIISGAFYTPKQGDIVVVSRDYMVEEDAFEEYIKESKECGLYETNVEVDKEDTIVMLSTCTNVNNEERLVVFGVKINE
jgi:signal peptidase I